MTIVADKDRLMDEALPDERRFWAAGFVASLVLHGLAALLLTGVISGYDPKPVQEPIEVELVSPPEEEEAPEVLPEEQPEEQEAEQQEAEQPQVPLPPPPPPAPAPQEQTDAQTPPEETPVMQPVEEFGEEDTGPQDEEAPEESEVAETGAESEDEATEEEPASEEAVSEEPQEAEAEQQPDETEETETAETTVPEPEPEPEQESEAGPAPDAGELPGEDAEEPAEDFGTVGRIETSATPAPKPARPKETARRESPPPQADLIQARELYSRDILDDARARTAMRGMSPGERLNLLCMTELRAQLSAASSAPPELLPSFRPRPGTVLQPGRAAFRSLGRWFDLAFRCETDGDVTRVESFAFKIGGQIPRSQWLERGLTGF